MYDSWKTYIWLYIKGKENGEMLIDSIKKGHFQLKKEITIPGIDGAADEKRAQTVEDLSPKEKTRYDCNIKATNILFLRVQNVQGRQSQGYAINTTKSQATRTRVINIIRVANANQPKAIRCYKYRDQQDFLAARLEEMDSNCDDLQLHTTSNFKANHVNAYDSDCDDEATTCAIFMVSLSPAGSLNGDIVAPTYDSYILFEVPHYDTYHENDVLNSVVQETKYT
nr:hypothetical protein [Tanacetum cinerariifolium]GEZ50617.1 hypothetical protein [Tanacetum cinerariifolium]GEZ52863.1 hypothetical protein [Tanacetum cinerariifolium]